MIDYNLIVLVLGAVAVLLYAIHKLSNVKRVLAQNRELPQRQEKVETLVNDLARKLEGFRLTIARTNSRIIDASQATTEQITSGLGLGDLENITLESFASEMGIDEKTLNNPLLRPMAEKIFEQVKQKMMQGQGQDQGQDQPVEMEGY